MSKTPQFDKVLAEILDNLQPHARTCKQCSVNFDIFIEDIEMYKKLQVPPPTLCPECRMQRRFGFYNNILKFHKKECSAHAGENVISTFHSESPHKIFDLNHWWSDKWGGEEYGRDYDLNRPFFEQFKKLMFDVPQPAITHYWKNVIDSPYTISIIDSKNCYYSSVGVYLENSHYLYWAGSSRDSMDCLNSQDLENCYENIYSDKMFNSKFCDDSTECIDSAFLRSCKNCQNCFGCVNLRNKQNCFFDEQLSKEEYSQKLEEMGLDSFSGISRAKDDFDKFKTKFINKYMHGQKNINVVGDFLFDSKNVFQVYNSNLLEDCKYANYGNGAKDCYDFYVNVDGSQFSYDTISGIALNNVKFSSAVWHNYNLDYCDTCENSNNLFGCIGLRKKQYCILNKQYTKEEYEQLRGKIIKQMDEMPYVDKKGMVYKYGEFFPPELSPFAYNETVAQEYFSLTKEQAFKQGYAWKDSEEKSVNITMCAEDLPGRIKDVSDSIVQEIIRCGHKGECNEQCTKAFKIIQAELDFYRKMNLPLPRLCPNCRHAQRIKQRNPLKLYKRTCQCAGIKSENGVYQNTIAHTHGTEPCPNEFETTYSPDRKEIVYCEQCYQQEVA